MRQKPNLYIEKLCDNNGLKFERKTWKMMDLKTEQWKQKEEKLSAEDLQDEDKLKKLMS